MSRKILFLQGGGEGAYVADQKLADSLQETLGAEYEVIYPPMPNEDAPTYSDWKNHVANTLAALDGEVIAVGHSFGASIWLKYLSEEQDCLEKITHIFLIATPYWGAEDWEVEEYALREDFAAHLPNVPICLFHSRDDEIVPFTHLALYREKLPRALIHEFSGRGHQFNDDLSEVASKIAAL